MLSLIHISEPTRRRGIYLAPSPYELAFLSTAHNQQILSETLKAVEDTLKNQEL